MTNPFHCISLRTRIVFLVVVLVIAGIWGLVVRITAVLQSDIENLLSAQLASTVSIVADDIDSKFQSRIGALNQIAASISPDMLAHPEKLQRMLEQPSIVGATAGMDFFVANKQGVVIADYPRIPGRQGSSLADRAHFREAMASAKVVIGAPLRGRIARRRMIVPIVVPVRDASGAAVGVVVDPLAITDLNVFGQIEQTKIGQTGFFVVMSPKDHLRVIASGAYRSQSLTPLPAPGVNPLLDRRLREGYEGPGITVNSFGTEVLNVSRNMPTTGWLLLAGVETKEVFAPIARLKYQVYLAALIITVLVAAILRFVLARQFARLEQAGQAMRRMSAGEQPMAAIPVRGEDEIGHLLGNFNQLVGERNRIDEERQQANGALARAMTRLQALSDRITMSQEEERREIAFELHEQSAQDLTALKVQLETLRHYCRGQSAQVRLQDALTSVRSMQERVRNMALDLYSPQLNDFGLYATLRAHCGRQAYAAGWSLHFDTPEAGERPHRDIELACFRVAQEALANIVRHADASEVWVSLQQCGDELQLSLRDNGVGFDTSEVSDDRPDKNLGLFGMAERIRQVGGRLEIKSSPGCGTEIVAVFPRIDASTRKRIPTALVLSPISSPAVRFDRPGVHSGNSTSIN